VELWGIDLGGTKIEGAIVDSDDPTNVRCRLRVPTGSASGYEHVVGQIKEVIDQLERTSGVKRPRVVGIGTPGAVEPSTGALKNSNTTCLNGRSLRDDLNRVLGVEARLANDANCFALAEARFGAAQGRRVVFGIIMGTGVGGGLVFEGQTWNGRHGIGGEWGHNPICGETTPCYCGRVGCVETVIAGPSLERFYRQTSGVAARLPEIAVRAAAGEAAAVATLERLTSKLGEALAALINILDPDAVVFGGGVGNLDVLYSEATRAAIRKHLFNADLRTELLKPALGDSAGVFGAALLAST
jgi:predicted NBD/HSP70 family sugar kinase